MNNYKGPKFLIKLYEILQDGKYIDVIYWNNEGDAFEITNKEILITKVLKIHYKQSNFKSFQRQLNQYGFHKQKLEKNVISFKHSNFVKDEEQLLSKIISSHKQKIQVYKTQQIENVLTDQDQQQMLNAAIKELQQNQYKIFKQFSDQMEMQKHIKQHILQIKENIANFSMSIEQYCFIAQNLLIQVLNQIPNKETYSSEIELLKRVLQEFSNIYQEYYALNQVSPNNSMRCFTPAPFYITEQQKNGLINTNKQELQNQIQEYLIWVQQSYEQAIQKTQI